MEGDKRRVDERISELGDEETPSKEGNNMKRCKGCGKRVPKKNDQVGFVCQVLGYCRRCYEERFPERPMWHLPPLRWGSEAVLSYDDRRRLTQGRMTSEEMASMLSREEALEELIRQQDFYDEWIDYLEHWKS